MTSYIPGASGTRIDNECRACETLPAGMTGGGRIDMSSRIAWSGASCNHQAISARCTTGGPIGRQATAPVFTSTSGTRIRSLAVALSTTIRASICCHPERKCGAVSPRCWITNRSVLACHGEASTCPNAYSQRSISSSVIWPRSKINVCTPRLCSASITPARVPSVEKSTSRARYVEPWGSNPE